MVWNPIQAALAQGGEVFLASAFLGALAGCLAGGLATAWGAHALARRMFRNHVLDHARKELKGPLADYSEWLASVHGSFAMWKLDLLPAYLPDSGQDQFELNRMRRLFVDQRNALWIDRLEEYDAILPNLAPAVKDLWMRQGGIAECFDAVFRHIESDPPEAAKAGERLEALAFEQGQLVSDLIYHLQYECLRDIAARKPRVPGDLVKPRLIRTGSGKVRVASPPPGRGHG
jgi:hypothetical protein